MALIEPGNSLGEIRDKINCALVPFTGPDDLAAAAIPKTVTLLHVNIEGSVYQLIPDAAGSWISGDGRTWRVAAADVARAEAASATAIEMGAQAAQAAQDAQQAAADLGARVVTVDGIVSGQAQTEDGSLVLVGFQNGRAAVVQKPDGVDFVPSAALRERLDDGSAATAEAALEAVAALTSDGGAGGDEIVLVGFQNGRAALVQRADGLDFVPSATLKDQILDGLSRAEATSAGTPLVQFRNGRVAIMQMADGLDFEPSQAFITRLPIPTPDLLSSTAIELNGVNGQSHSIGGPWDSLLNYAQAMTFASRAALQLTGTFRSDGAEVVNSMGPGQYGYDTAINATGLANAVPGTQQIGLPFAVFAQLNAHRADLGVPQLPSLTGAHGIGGIPLDQMVPGSTVWTSFTFWNAQAKARAEAAGRTIKPGWHVFNHGGAGKLFPRGQYRAEWVALQKQCLEYWRSIGLSQPRYIMTQTGGEANTTNDTPGSWAVAEDQLDLVEMGCAALGTCDYWYPIWDNQVHWDAHGTALAGETIAWGIAEIEAGRGWSITRPRIVSNMAGSLVLSFDSLREDEQLAIEDGSKYNGEGIDAFLGFQLSGGTITSVDVTGKQVAIAYSGAPSAVKYARQVQDVSTYAGNKYPAHRGLLRTSLRKPSKFFPGEKLVRAIPSFTLSLGA